MTGLLQRLDKGPSPDPDNVRYRVRRSRILEKIPEETGTEGYPHIPVFTVPLLEALWPSQANPPTGTTEIGNAGSLGADEEELSGTAGSVVVASPSTVTYTGGGYNFSGVAARAQAMVTFPPGALAGIASQQEFLLGIFGKLPSIANWNTSTTQILPFHAGNGANGIGVGNPTFVTLGQITVGSTPNVAGIRQRGSGQTQLAIPAEEDDGDELFFLGMWRGGSTGNEGLALWTPPVGLRTATTALAAANSNDISALVPRSGIPIYGWPADMTTGNAALARQWSWHGHFLEDLAGSGRSAIDVINTAIGCAEDLIAAGKWS